MYFYCIMTVKSPRDSYAMLVCTKHARNIRAFAFGASEMSLVCTRLHRDFWCNTDFYVSNFMSFVTYDIKVCNRYYMSR